MKTTASILLAASICLFRFPAAAPATSRPLAITHVTLLTMTRGTVENGTLLVEKGKIKLLGTDVPIPADAEILDGHGKFLMPGLIDPHSHLGDYPLPGDLEAYDDGNEMTGNIQSRVRSMDSINPEDPEIARAVSGGVTTVQVLPGSGNNVGGQAYIIKLLGTTAEEMHVADAPPTMKMAWGENPKRASLGTHPETLMGEMAVVRQAFYDARHYLAEKEQWEKEKKGAPPKMDLNLAALADVLSRNIRLHIHSYQVNHFGSLFNLQDEFNLNISAFHHALNAYKIAPEIKKRGISVVTFADLWGYKAEAWDAIPQNAWILWKLGVNVSLHTDNPVIEQKYLIVQAAIVSHYGVPPETALQMVTINPARILGIDHRVGSLEEGKDADLVLWDGFPLSPRSRVQRVWINGNLVYVKGEGYLPWRGKETFIP